MRQQTQFLWDTYFSSIEKIVGTTLEVPYKILCLEICLSLFYMIWPAVLLRLFILSKISLIV